MENQTRKQTLIGFTVALALFATNAKAGSYQEVWQATQEGKYSLRGCFRHKKCLNYLHCRYQHRSRSSTQSLHH